MRSNNCVVSLLAAVGTLGAAHVALGQIATDTLWASSVVTNNAWTDESEAAGDPNCSSCNCNSTLEPYSFLSDTADQTWLEANLDNVDPIRIPSNYLITSFRVDVMGRYNTGTIGEFEMQYFQYETWFGPDAGTGVYNSPNFTSGTTCEYRWGNGGVEVLLPGETVAIADVNAMKLRVRRGNGALDAETMRVKAFRVQITAERDLDGDSIVDSVDTDDDNDGISDTNDCAPADPQRWRRSAFLDPDNDGVRNSATLVDTGVCFGTQAPAGFTANANGLDNCLEEPNPTQA
ncbi:MAG: hypothetical protein ACOYN0_17135, partial [Phycisphaerales bacterium]